MAIISKLLNICKTRAKKSSPDMFHFKVLLAGHYMVTDAGTSTTCRRKIKPHDYEQKVQKMKDLSKTWVLKGKQFEDFRQKQGQKDFSQPFKKTPVGHQDPKSIN